MKIARPAVEAGFRGFEQRHDESIADAPKSAAGQTREIPNSRGFATLMCQCRVSVSSEAPATTGIVAVKVAASSGATRFMGVTTG